MISSSSLSNIFCPECYYPGSNVHYTGCSKVRNTPALSLLSEADIRRIVREELERAALAAQEKP